MNFEKAHFDIDGTGIKFSVPIAKVDQEHRTVSGFATLDNVDRQGDIVSTEASLEAFNEFRGNLREMHQSKAVGKVLSFSVEEFYDPTSNKIYSGIFVTAYISKGAPDTWEKVLDGTLTGFSIGGEIQEVENVFDKSLNAIVRHITKYSLIELSVVDSPANQLANIFSVVKADGAETTFKGMAVDVKTENIFWCDTHQVAVIKDAESQTCAECSKPMENIGWVEKDDVDKADTIRSLIKNYQGQSDLVDTLGEGGKEMQEETTNEVVVEDAIVEKSDAVEEVAEAVADEAVEETVEKAVEVDEVVTDEPDLVKMIGDIRDFVSTVEKNSTAHAEELSALAKAVSDNSTQFSEALGAIATKHDELAAVVAGLSAAIEGVTEKVDAIDKADAVKKSGDLGRSAEVKKNDNIWSGTFLVRK